MCQKCVEKGSKSSSCEDTPRHAMGDSSRGHGDRGSARVADDSASTGPVKEARAFLQKIPSVRICLYAGNIEEDMIDAKDNRVALREGLEAYYTSRYMPEKWDSSVLEQYKKYQKEGRLVTETGDAYEEMKNSLPSVDKYTDKQALEMASLAMAHFQAVNTADKTGIELDELLLKCVTTKMGENTKLIKDRKMAAEFCMKSAKAYSEGKQKPSF